MKILHAILGGLREGGTWNKWKPKFRWSQHQFEFEYNLPKPFGLHGWKLFELEKGERKAWCIFVDAEKHDLESIKQCLEILK